MAPCRSTRGPRGAPWRRPRAWRRVGGSFSLFSLTSFSSVVGHVLGLVLQLDQRAALFVGRLVGRGRPCTIFSTSSLERPELWVMVTLASLLVALILRRHLQDAVGVDVEGDLDLRHAARGGRNAGEMEAAQAAVVGGHLALALQHVDLDLGLPIGRGRELLGLAGGDGGVLLDESGEDAAQRLDAERQRRHVEQQNVFHLARQHRRPAPPRRPRPPRRGSPCGWAPSRTASSPPPAPWEFGWSRRPARPRRPALASTPASLRHLRVGPSERSTRSSIIASNFARDSFTLRCRGPTRRR